MDTTMIGEAAASAMEHLADEFGDGVEPAAVVVIVVADVAEQTFTRVYATVERYYEQIGILADAAETIRSGAGDRDD